MSDRTPINKRVVVRIIVPTESAPGSKPPAGKNDTPFRPLQHRSLVRPRAASAVKTVDHDAPLPVVKTPISASRGSVAPATKPALPSPVPEVANPEMLASKKIFAAPGAEPAAPQALTSITAPVELEPFEQVEPSSPITVSDVPEELILWEQPPVAGGGIHERPLLPRWVNDVSAVPTESEYAELGNYLVFLVDGFSNFCSSPSVTQSGQWQGRMRMPAAVLPDTMLQLDVSPLHAKLRFETDHAVSRELLSRNINELQKQVKVALDDSREVEVTVW